ncbi:L-threonylcarbamoyladenylate synthase [Pancytospora philotis]|nr:L-threonylcarbamoyladenylate synthase [Pancytospora philotis]
MRVTSLDEAVEEFEKDAYERPFVIPTETVYGLAARVDREDALREIFKIKGRPTDNPLIVHVSSPDMLRDLVSGSIPEEYQRLMKRFWPGPLTLIFNASDGVSPVIKGNGQSTVAVRMPRSPQLCRLIDRIGVPLAAPSANTSGRPSPTTVQHVVDDFGARVEHYIDDGPCAVGLESTVFGIIKGRAVILRPGCITREDIEAVIGREVCVENKAVGGEVLSPGQKYKHYSPCATVFLFRGADWKDAMARKAGELGERRIGVMGSAHESYGFTVHKRFDLGQSSQDVCRGIFAGLRALDKSCDAIFIRAYATDHEGLAIMDRLEKASTHIIE